MDSRPVIRIVIVDDHEMVRNALAAVMADEPGVEVVGTGGTIDEALDIASKMRPDVVLMDYRLPDGDGAQGARALRHRLPDVKVIMLTGRDDEATRAEAAAAGCVGFVAKGARLDRVAETVRAAAGLSLEQSMQAE